MALFSRKHKKIDNESLKYGIGLVTYSDPTSSIAEQFRTVRTNIQFSSIDKQLSSVLFTSSEPAEGKSTISNNVAVTWADQGKKVILIDADLRRPTVHRTFSVSNSKGLSTVLSGNDQLEDVVQKTVIPNLFVITSGPIPPNPSELLNSSRMDALLKDLNDQSDLLIIDAPPVNAVTDAQVLAARVDGTILVVPQGIADKGGVRHAKQLLDAVHANILGSIMNRVKADKTNGYYGGYYGTDEK